MRNKQPRYREKVEYILSDKGEFNKDKGFVLFHNLSGTDVDTIVNDYKENDEYRIKRKNGTALLHEVMSFHKDDKKNITKAMLWDLANTYIQHRGGHDCLALASVHWEHDCPHVHFIFSYNRYRSNKTLNLNNKEFKNLRIEMEKIQQERYPHELSNSIVYTKKRDKEKKLGKVKKSEKEVQMTKRTGEKSHKDIVSAKLVQLYGTSKSTDEFLDKLVEANIGMYRYKGKPMGVLFEKKRFRFSRLGISQEAINTLNISYARIKQLEKIRKKKERQKSKGRSR